MNHFVFYILIINFSLNCFSQENLVYNGDFEIYSDCPTAGDLNNGEFEKCTGWWDMTEIGSCDYFNLCNNSLAAEVGIPYNYRGYQNSFNGNGYIGQTLYAYGENNTYIGGEFSQSRLQECLDQCGVYKIQLQISASDYSSFHLPEVHVAFSMDSLKDAPVLNFNSFNLAKLVTKIDSCLKDTANWFQLEYEYIARGNEKYISIGYFDEEIVLEDTCTSAINYYSPYAVSNYYIDNVSMVKADQINDCKVQTTILYNFPNVITVNNDGINDRFNIYDFLPENTSIEIFNRWGNSVAVLDELNPIWDGNLDSKLVVEGTYFYQITIKNECQDILQIGFIHVFN